MPSPPDALAPDVAAFAADAVVAELAAVALPPPDPYAVEVSLPETPDAAADEIAPSEPLEIALLPELALPPATPVAFVLDA